MDAEYFLKSEIERGRFTPIEEKTETTETVTTETPTETKVETTETKPEVVETKVETPNTTETPLEEKQKSVLDILGSLNKEEVKTEAVELPEDIKAKLALADKYEQFQKSELAKLLDSDLTLSDLINSVQIIDYSKMTAEQLIEAEAKLVAGDRFTDELLEAELEAYNSLTPKAKIEFEKNLIDKLGKSKTEINNELASLIDKHQASKKEATPQFNFQEVEQAERTKLTTTLSELTTKHGLDAEIAKGIEDLYNVQLAGAFVDKSGQFNEVEFTKFAYKVVAYEKDMAAKEKQMVEAVLEAEKRAYEKAKKEFTSPTESIASDNVDANLSADQVFKSLKFN